MKTKMLAAKLDFNRELFGLARCCCIYLYKAESSNLVLAEWW